MRSWNLFKRQITCEKIKILKISWKQFFFCWCQVNFYFKILSSRSSYDWKKRKKAIFCWQYFTKGKSFITNLVEYAIIFFVIVLLKKKFGWIQGARKFVCFVWAFLAFPLHLKDWNFVEGWYSVMAVITQYLLAQRSCTL